MSGRHAYVTNAHCSKIRSTRFRLRTGCDHGAVPTKPLRRRVFDFIWVGPENSIINWRRRYISDRIWFGLGFLSGGFVSYSEFQGWWKLISVFLVVTGSPMVISGIHRRQRRRRSV